jgi:hypothetical protein
MKTVQIVRGKFTDNGNFSAYDAAGIDRIHVPSGVMESAGLKKGDTIKFPLYAIVVERTFDVLDEQGNPKEGATFKRLQAGSIFSAKADMIEAANGNHLLEAETKADLISKASAAGLTQEAINALQAVA